MSPSDSPDFSGEPPGTRTQGLASKGEIGNPGATCREEQDESGPKAIELFGAPGRT